MLKFFYPLLLLLLLSGSALTAQDIFNVRIGTFQDVKADDFVDLQEMGFVYGLPREGQLTDVYLGNYSSRDRAATVTEQLQARGFRNAAPFALPAGVAEPATYVQIALRGKGRSLDWRSLERAGKLFVDARDGVTKVLTGPYPNAEAANEALAGIRTLGYGDAFVRTAVPGKLIPIGVFETGIKKPLIPIELRQIGSPDSPATDASTAPAPPPAPTPAPAPDTTETVAATTAVAIQPPPAPAATPHLAATQPGLPPIDVKTKRHSAAELQRVLKEKGYYDGSIDGYYGEGTRSAYQEAWNKLPELRKYRLLAASEDVATGTLLSWPEIAVVTTVADELAAGMTNTVREEELAEARDELFNATAALPAADATRARTWESTVWENLNDWAVQDPLHARILTALRVSYYQAQARLEAMYLQRGMSAIAARDLATATLQNLLGAPLDRFL
ncbi:hypothetical protein GGR28_001211 [Lewinella aquimaris]|uniref:Peptidoglycan binding-like domain-containing protein n=1 Tax=Neolewinella aquimaris TaxID=1835722 RepID=A0A840E968_9BACT|nr:peptidoglycan-binding domain-containing protein [Neolewinella aquimaris]MBB4078598.1 hypothetical protein [Neolewinella aquimaris]